MSEKEDDMDALRVMWSILTDPDPKRAKLLMKEEYSERLCGELLINLRQELHALSRADRAFHLFMRKALS